VATSVIGVLAQRLVRKICERCKMPMTHTDAVLRDAGITAKMANSASFMKGRGCNNCSKSGYRGRMGIYELLMITSKIREMIFKQKSSTDIRIAGINQGMKTLYMDGILKVCKGITSLEEVYRNAKRTEQDVFS
jgi:type IV pilus assembly protein PilB